MAKQTIAYGMFLPNPKQRKYNPLRTKDLMARMRAFGFPESMAISVYRENGKFHINSGHHRLEAAKALKIPVWYVLEEKWKTEALLSEGTSNTSWKLHDIAHAWADDGTEDYALLLSYCSKGIGVQLAVSLLSGEATASGNKNDAFKDGRFKVVSTVHIDKVVHALEELASNFPAASTLSFQSAVAALVLIEGFSLDQLIGKIKSAGELHKTATRNQMLEQLETIYNFRSKSRDNIAFKALEELRGRSLINKNKGERKEAEAA